MTQRWCGPSGGGGGRGRAGGVCGGVQTRGGSTCVSSDARAHLFLLVEALPVAVGDAEASRVEDVADLQAAQDALHFPPARSLWQHGKHTPTAGTLHTNPDMIRSLLHLFMAKLAVKVALGAAPQLPDEIILISSKSTSFCSAFPR